MAAHCAQRCIAREASGAGRGHAVYEPCAHCPLGARRAASLAAGGWVAPRYRAFDPRRRLAGILARRRLDRSGALASVPTIDG
jgi:hypothetical protein